MGMSCGSLVPRRGRHRLTCGSHNVASLRRGMLRQYSGRGLIHGVGVLTGALPTQRHLIELGGQLFSLEVRGIMQLLRCD